MELSIGRDKPGLAKALESVSNCLEEYIHIPLENKEIQDILAYAASSKGKMLRPRLLLISAMFGKDFSEKEDVLQRVAAMLEMIHMASLIHDDIIDDSPLRRGAQTVQAKFGKDVAVYTGDFLLARVLRLMAREGLNVLERRYADDVEQVCLGEIGQDVNRFNPEVTVEQYLDNIRGKTAMLFKIACGTGAELSGCDADMVELLETIGEKLGMLFQLRDDLLDFTSEEKALGKAAQIDFSEGVYTMPVLCARDCPSVHNRMAELMRRNAECKVDSAAIEEVIRLVKESGALDETRRRMAAFEAEIREAVAQLPENPAHEMLLELVGGLTHV